MTDIPQEAAEAAAEAIALGMTIRNSPRQLAWDALEAAAPLLAGTPSHAETVATEWGVRDDGPDARGGLGAGRPPGALVRRTVTYGPWEEMPGEH